MSCWYVGSVYFYDSESFLEVVKLKPTHSYDIFNKYRIMRMHTLDFLEMGILVIVLEILQIDF